MNVVGNFLLLQVQQLPRPATAVQWQRLKSGCSKSCFSIQWTLWSSGRGGGGQQARRWPRPGWAWEYFYLPHKAEIQQTLNLFPSRCGQSMKIVFTRQNGALRTHGHLQVWVMTVALCWAMCLNKSNSPFLTLVDLGSKIFLLFYGSVVLTKKFALWL